MNNPYIKIIVTFAPEQKEVCEKCHKDIWEMIRRFYENKSSLRNHFEDGGIDYCMEGWYFSISISLRETDLIRKITDRISIYNSDGQKTARIKPTLDPFHPSWMICSNCGKLLYQKYNVPETIPDVCPNCLCIFEK